MVLAIRTHTHIRMNEIYQSWLSMQCQMLHGVSRAVIVLGASSGDSVETIAVWPEGGDGGSSLQAAAARAAISRKRVVESGETSSGGAEIIAAPLFRDDRLLGVIAVEMGGDDADQIKVVAKMFKIGAAWLEVMISQRQTANSERLAGVVQLLAHCLEQDRFEAAARVFVNQLAAQLSCTRVSLGLLKGNSHRVKVISHAAQTGRNANLLKAIGVAMDEARDQGCSVVHPAPEEGRVPITLAHRELAKNYHVRSIATVLLLVQGRTIGAVTLERAEEEPFEPDRVRFCEQVGLLVAPVLELKQRDERSLQRHARDTVSRGLHTLFGPHHVLAKLGSLLAAGLLAFMLFATGAYRVAADAVIEPAIQQAVVAPQEGYVATASIRAGDLVSRGSLLGTLEDRDLELERSKWHSERDKLHKEYRSALATHDRSKVSVLDAQVAQAEAELELVNERLRRTQLLAPFDGIVVSGDLSRSLGSPVERGQVLFEIAPLDAYRVVLQVDETEISRIQVGQRGHLALAAVPDRSLPLVVDKITPVAEASEQQNRFRVEARLEVLERLLRPGMSGIAKIEIEQRSLFWIWTHRLFDWLRLRLWSWWL